MLNLKKCKLRQRQSSRGTRDQFHSTHRHFVKDADLDCQHFIQLVTSPLSQLEIDHRNFSCYQDTYYSLKQLVTILNFELVLENQSNKF